MCGAVEAVTAGVGRGKGGQLPRLNNCNDRELAASLSNLFLCHIHRKVLPFVKQTLLEAVRDLPSRTAE